MEYDKLNPIVDYDRLNEKNKTQLGTVICFFIILISLICVVCYYTGVFDEAKKFFNYHFSDEIEVTFQEGTKIDVTPTASDIRAQAFGLNEFHGRLKDGSQINLTYIVKPTIKEKDRSKIRQALRVRLSQITTEQLYTDPSNNYRKELMQIIVDNYPEDLVWDIIEIKKIQFPARIVAEFQNRREYKNRLEKAKVEVEIAKAEKKVIQMKHEAEMEALKMERQRKLFEAETQKMVNQVIEHK